MNLKRFLLAGVVAFACLGAPLGAVPAFADTPATAVYGALATSLSGFTPWTNTLTPVTISSNQNISQLPGGTTVVIYNTGQVAAYLEFGNSSATVTTTAYQYIVAPNTWLAVVVGANTYLAGISQSGSTTLYLSGGAGIPTAGQTVNASSSGSSGGSSNALTWPGTATPSAFGSPPTGTVPAVNASVTAVEGAFPDGAISTIGTKADAASAAIDTTPASVVSLLKEISAKAQSPLSTANGWTYKLGAAISTTVVTGKSSAGELGMAYCYNPGSSGAYLQIFDAASPTLGSTAPAMSIGIGAGVSGGFALSDPGVNFANAIKFAATTTATGSSAPASALDCSFAVE